MQKLKYNYNFKESKYKKKLEIAKTRWLRIVLNTGPLKQIPSLLTRTRFVSQGTTAGTARLLPEKTLTRSVPKIARRARTDCWRR